MRIIPERFCFLQALCDVPGHIHTAGTGMGQGVSDTAAVTDDEQALVGRFQILVQLDLHVVELDLHAVEQGVIIGGAGGDLIQRISMMPSRMRLGITRLRSPGVAASVGVTKLSSTRLGVERWPRIRSPNRWTMTPPPSILDSRAMLSP